MQRASSTNCEMVRAGVGVGVDAERDDSHLARGARDAHRDLAAIGDRAAARITFVRTHAAAALEERAQTFLAFGLDALAARLRAR